MSTALKPAGSNPCPLHEQHEGKTVWSGNVQVFEIDHPQASRCYAWSHESGTWGRRRSAARLLGVSPVDSAVMALRAAVLGEVKRARTN